jgi:hypothetical protein
MGLVCTHKGNDVLSMQFPIVQTFLSNAWSHLFFNELMNFFSFLIYLFILSCANFNRSDNFSNTIVTKRQSIRSISTYLSIFYFKSKHFYKNNSKIKICKVRE